MQIFTHLKSVTLSVAALGCFTTAFAQTPDGYRTLATYDFLSTPLSEKTLETGKVSPGYLYNAANSTFNAVYYCTTTGLDKFVFQELYSSNKKGWSINSTGLNMSGAGRVAGLSGLKTDQIVDITYTGGSIYSEDKTTETGAAGKSNVDKDCAATKEVYLEESGHVQYKMTADGIVPFELSKGYSITKIIVYEPNIGLGAPAISIEGKTYATQLVTITNPTEGATTYYTVNNGTAQIYNAPFRLTESATVKTWNEQGTEVSDTVSASVTAGVLPTPSYSVPADESETTLTLSSTIDGAVIFYNEQQYDAPVSITQAEDVTIYAVYEETVDGETYTFKSEPITLSIQPYELKLAQTIDLSKAAWPSVTEDKTEVVLSDEAVETIGETAFHSATILDVEIENLLLEAGSAWLKRVKSGSGTLYSFNSSSKQIGIQNVKVGQLVVLTGYEGLSSFYIGTVSEDYAVLDPVRTVEGKRYVFVAKADGTLPLYVGKNCYVEYIKNYDNLSEDNGATGITNIRQEAAGAQPIYDLQGRRVQNMNRAGLYIVGGQKIVVK
jgi:hypothetical protein